VKRPAGSASKLNAPWSSVKTDRLPRSSLPVRLTRARRTAVPDPPRTTLPLTRPVPTAGAVSRAGAWACPPRPAPPARPPAAGVGAGACGAAPWAEIAATNANAASAHAERDNRRDRVPERIWTPAMFDLVNAPGVTSDGPQKFRADCQRPGPSTRRLLATSSAPMTRARELARLRSASLATTPSSVTRLFSTTM